MRNIVPCIVSVGDREDFTSTSSTSLLLGEQALTVDVSNVDQVKQHTQLYTTEYQVFV